MGEVASMPEMAEPPVSNFNVDPDSRKNAEDWGEPKVRKYEGLSDKESLEFKRLTEKQSNNSIENASESQRLAELYRKIDDWKKSHSSQKPRSAWDRGFRI